MLSIRALYDGKKFTLIDKIDINAPQKVIITFLEENYDDVSTDELAQLAAGSKSFDFLKNKMENIYTDDDLKIKYKR